MVVSEDDTGAHRAHVRARGGSPPIPLRSVNHTKNIFLLLEGARQRYTVIDSKWLREQCAGYKNLPAFTSLMVDIATPGRL